MLHYISKMQPVGDAAAKLRELVPDLDQLVAVSILRNADNGQPWVSLWPRQMGYTVSSIRRDDIMWTVTTP